MSEAKLDSTTETPTKDSANQPLHADNERSGKASDKEISDTVYQDSKAFNTQFGLLGVSILYAIKQLGGQLVNNGNVAMGAGTLALGTIEFFANRNFRQKGDQSTYSYMGQLSGAVKFIGGLTLFTLEGAKLFMDTGEPSAMLSALQLATTGLVVAETTLILLNAGLYANGVPKTPAAPAKMHAN